MAKTIRPILCPQCGSPAKTTLGPELFRCNACQTEYYLDTDDVTVTVRHQYAAPPAAPPQSQALRYGWAGIFLVIAVGALAWLAVRQFHPGYFNNIPATTIATKPIFYLTNYVYADAERQPVYATLRTEGPRWGADSVTLYAGFYDVRTGKLRREQVLEPLGRRLDNHSYEWHTFPGGQVYLLGNQHLYRVGHNPDRLLDVTTTLLNTYAPASTGIAEYKFDSRYEALQVLTNEGQTFYYLPASRQLLADGPALYQAAYANLPRRFFTFEWHEGDVLAAGTPLLLANRPTGHYPTIAFDNLTQRRRFFDPRVLYQDANALLVAVAPTAKPNSPHQVQRLDVATGRVLWSRPASSYDFQEAVRTPDGFALGYRSGPELDYVHGALLLADDGRELSDFQRKRME